jgi:hypothetical protein
MFGNDISNNPNNSPSEEFVDNYNMDSGSSSGYGANNFSLSEKMQLHCLGGHVVLLEHWTACKATPVFFARAKKTSKSISRTVLLFQFFYVWSRPFVAPICQYELQGKRYLTYL